MKKTMSVILAAVMVLTMAAFTTACGDKESASGMQTSSQAAEGTSGTDAGSASGSVFPAALKDVPAIEVPSIAITGWELTGGMIDGVEMEQSDLDATLQACGGKLQFIFPDESKKAQLINGEKSFEGTYEITKDNFAFHAKFTGYEYYGVFTKVGETTVMILANKEAPETALYMTQIDEH